MEKLSAGLPVIINDRTEFSCFGIVRGSVTIIVKDNGTNCFPTTGIVQTNLGGGEINQELCGNGQWHREVSGMKVTVTVSNWRATAQSLSFHIKIVAKRSIFSCTVLDKTLRSARHNKALQDDLLESLTAQLDASKK
jgi:hypothetical protein